MTATRAARMPPGGDCRVLDDTGDQKCAGPALVAPGVAGLGGAAIGAGIDALFVRAPSLRMRVRF